MMYIPFCRLFGRSAPLLLMSLLMSAAASATSITFTQEESVWLEKNPSIRIGVMDAWPPMDYVDSAGQPQGIGVQFIQAMNQYLGGRIKIVPNSWKINYASVKEGRLDALMDITPREDRKPFFNFTKPYIEVPHNIITRKEFGGRSVLADLKGDVVGIERGFFIAKLLREKYPEVTVKEFDSTSDVLDAVTTERVDAYVGNRAVAAHIIKRELINNLKIQGKISETSSINAIGVRKDLPILRSILDKALAAVPEVERRKIHEQWVGTGEQPFDYLLILEIVLPVLAILIILGGWNWQLRWMVGKRTAEIKEISALQTAILDNAGYAIIATDEKGMITVFNHAAEKMLGYSSGEVIGRERAEIFHSLIELEQRAKEYGDELGGFLRPGFETVVAHAKAGQPSESEYTYVDKGGNEFPVLLTVTALKDATQGIQGYLGIAVNITNQKKSEQALITAKEGAEAASLAKDEFLASMSHELRTPLTSIIGNSEYLAELESDAKKRDIVRSIESAGKSQLALVNDILDMSKIQSGKFSIDDFPYNLTSLLNDVKDMVSIRAQDAGLKLEFAQEGEEHSLLLGDSNRIGQILINLLTNAIKFTEFGAVKLSCWNDGEHLFFKVEDSGIGMSPDTLERVFARFEQADSSISKRFGGSGLGLFISLNLAELMGGTITASSQEGVGSIFELTLPYQKSSIPVVDIKESALIDTELNKTISGTVLIAEDTPLLQQLERRTLEAMGLTVTIAENGQEALELATAQRFDIILMDMQMPIMDGIEATRALRDAGNRTPIIAFSANVMQKHRDAFSEAGCDGFIGKPFDQQELRRLLTHHLGHVAAEEEVQKVISTLEPIVWDESYSVGNPVMDQQHQRLVGYINGLIECCREGKPRSSNIKALEILPKLNSYATSHFEQEELLLQQLNYGAVEQQADSHRAYGQKIASFYSTKMEFGQVLALTQYLLGWWKNHILVEDMAYKTHVEGGALEEKPAAVSAVVDDEMMVAFQEFVIENRAGLELALSSQEWSEVKKIAHQIKGSGTPFGFPQLTQSATVVCDAYDTEQLSQLPELSAALIEELNRTVSQ